MTDPKEMRLLRQEYNEKMKDELKKQDIRLNKLCFDYYGKDKRIKELEKENEKLKEKSNKLTRRCECLTKCNDGLQDLLSNDIDTLEQLIKAKKQIEKVKYTLKKIIETVQNDRIDEYGARIVLIKDFAYECLQELEK